MIHDPRLPEVMNDAAHDRNRVVEAAGPVLHLDAEAPLSAIAAAAGLSQLTVQHLFTDRDTLLWIVRAQALDALESAMAASHLGDGDALGALTRLAAETIARARGWALLPTVVWLNGTDPATRSRYARLTNGVDVVLQRGQDDGSVRTDLTLAEARLAFNAALVAGARDAATATVTPDAARATAVAEILTALAA